MAEADAGVSVLLRAGPERRIAVYYFASMMPAGAIGVHAGIWFSDNGLSSSQIGAVNTVPVLIMLCLNLTIGRLADRASDWRQAIVIGATLQATAALGLFAVDAFWGILAVWTMIIVPSSATVPITDAATVRLTRRRGSSFGTLRACATVGYLLAVFATGMLITWLGGDAFVPIFVAVNLLKAGAAQFLPRFRTPEAPSVMDGEVGVGRLIEAMRLWFVLPLVGFAMVFSTHHILNAFAALLWKAQGISSATIGQLIVVGAMAEAAMMFGWSWSRFGGRPKPGSCLVLAGIVAAIRWSCMALAPPVPTLVFLQLLHAITFGLGYLAVVQFIANDTHERIAAEAQSFYMIVQSLMVIIAVAGFGGLVDGLGFRAYFVASGFALLGVALIMAGLAARAPRRKALHGEQ
jgi:MFS transporter, PPP family, 3-phenylpropionic acid transporter